MTASSLGSPRELFLSLSSLPFPSLPVSFLRLVLCIDQTSCGKDTLRACILIRSNLCNCRVCAKQPSDFVLIKPFPKLCLFLLPTLPCGFLKPWFSCFLAKHTNSSFLFCNSHFQRKYVRNSCCDLESKRRICTPCTMVFGCFV